MAVVKKKKLKTKVIAKKKPIVSAKKKVVKTAKKKVRVKKATKPVKAKKVEKTASPKKKIPANKLKVGKTTPRKSSTSLVSAKRPLPIPIVSKKSEQKIGEVTHYYAQIGVAVVQLDQKSLRVGDTIHIKGHTTDFTQSVESMEVTHQPVAQAKAGDIFGIKVIQHVRVGDTVYR